MTDIGTIHFVGIGGIGMSGIAEVMHNLGYTVQGSDIAEGYVVEGLRKKRHQGDDRPQAAEKSGRCGGGGDIDRDQARQPRSGAGAGKRVPVVRRAEMLAELMRLKSTVAVRGTHGKTTTTSMIAALLDAGGVDPDRDQWRHHQRLWLQRAAGRRLDGGRGGRERRQLPALDGTIAVVTNIDPEHLDHYGDFDNVKDAFVEFVENVPFYGARCCASIIPRCRRSCRASAIGAS
jgi:UDP-N-acetylmuramate--alanine ligase